MHCSVTESTKIVDPHSRVVSSRCAFWVIHEFFSAPTFDGVDPRSPRDTSALLCSCHRKPTNIRLIIYNLLSILCREDALETYDTRYWFILCREDVLEIYDARYWFILLGRMFSKYMTPGIGFV